MSSQQSIENLIADRYASALYELSSETNCVDEVLSDLKIINKYINQNKDFRLLIRSPLITSSEKLLSIRSLEIAPNFFKVSLS